MNLVYSIIQARKLSLQWSQMFGSWPVDVMGHIDRYQEEHILTVCVRINLVTPEQISQTSKAKSFELLCYFVSNSMKFVHRGLN